MAKEWKPRLTVEITERQYHVLKQWLPHGMQKQVFQVIIEDLVDLLERFGYDVVIAIMSRQFSMVERFKKQRAIELLSAGA